MLGIEALTGANSQAYLPGASGTKKIFNDI
jgi:hypothetical protein